MHRGIYLIEIEIAQGNLLNRDRNNTEAHVGPQTLRSRAQSLLDAKLTVTISACSIDVQMQVAINNHHASKATNLSILNLENVKYGPKRFLLM